MGFGTLREVKKDGEINIARSKKGGYQLMQLTKEKVLDINSEQLNEDIKFFPQVHPITSDMNTTHHGVSRLVMLDRYAFKDTEKKT